MAFAQIPERGHHAISGEVVWKQNDGPAPHANVRGRNVERAAAVCVDIRVAEVVAQGFERLGISGDDRYFEAFGFLRAVQFHAAPCNEQGQCQSARRRDSKECR
jgi:hypothetical protein